MGGYTTEGWGEFFVAAAGATAALSGLIFVAVSVNIGAVLDEDKRSGGNFLIGPRAQAAPCRPFMAPPGYGWRPLQRSRPAWWWPRSRSPPATGAASSGFRSRLSCRSSSRLSTPGSCSSRFSASWLSPRAGRSQAAASNAATPASATA